MPDLREHREANGLVWLESETLSAPGGLAHGFSTRLGGVSRGPFASLNLGHTRGDDPDAVRENYCRFCAATGVGPVESLVLSHQIHRDGVRVCTLADRGKGLDAPRDYDADALMTDLPGLPLVIFSADCIPILFYDPQRRVIAACHAGWRGTALGIAAKTVRRMGEVYGCRPGDLRAAIGPGISQCCFQTGADVPEAMAAAFGRAAEPYCRPSGTPGRYQVDLKGLNAWQLEQAGVTRVDRASDCTACHGEKYWSHRITGPARGSMAAVIALID